MANKKRLVLYVSKEKFIDGSVRHLIGSNHHHCKTIFSISSLETLETEEGYKKSEQNFLDALREALFHIPHDEGDILEKGNMSEYEVKYNTEYSSFGNLTRTEYTNYSFDNPTSKVGLKEYEIEFFMKVLFNLRLSEMGQWKSSIYP